MDKTQLLKGVLDAAVLAVVESDDGYGYDIVRRLREGGLDDVGDASVYGTLRRLYSTGALTSYVLPSESGPHRKYYGITALGRTMLDEQRATWQSFSAAMCGLLGTNVRGINEAAHAKTENLGSPAGPRPASSNKAVPAGKAVSTTQPEIERSAA